MNKKQFVLGLLSTIATMSTYAQTADVEELDEVVITDSRFKIKRENSGKTVIKISKKELENSQGLSLAQLINTKSGITINGSNSAAGQSLGTYVRGGQNRQVLVLMDGVAINDASQIENNFDLNLIALDQIESIEILKGASSVLYGNRASTAVINITLKKSENGKVNANLSSFLGTNNSQDDSRLDIANFTNAVAINGNLKKLNYRASFSNTYTDGLSAIRARRDMMTTKSDPFSKYNGQLNLGYQFTKSFSISATSSFDTYRTSYDDSFGFIEAENTSFNEMYRFNVSPKFVYNKGEIQINTGYNKSTREYESSFPAKYVSKTYVVDAFNKYKFNDKFFTIVGLNYVKTEMDSYTIPFGGNSFIKDISSKDANDHIVDPYLNATFISDFGININAGVRLNNHSEYGSHFVYNINPSFVIKREATTYKVLSSISTAYITPSLYQLFAPFYGNTNLQPQEDLTIEAGLAFNYKNKLNFSALYFNRQQDKFIDYVILDYTTYAGEYQNVDDDFTVEGVEVELTYRPTSTITIASNYTFTERKEESLFRIPKHKVNASIQAQLKTNTVFAFTYQYNSNRVSPFLNDTFTAQRQLTAFNLLDVSINQVVIKNRLKVFASVHNIFNEDYEELYQFSTLGRNFKLGFNLSF